jgi:asparagine N-glycosylation enzyme membrane subunit Stt3
VLSFFQPWLLGALALAAAAWPGVALRGGAAPRPARGLAAAAVLGLVLSGATLLAFPQTLATLGDAWAWLARTERFQAQVAESQPLFLPEGRFSVAVAERQLGRALYGLPFLLAWLWASSRGRPDAARRRLVAGFGTGLLAAALVQHRFVNCLSVPYALVLGWAGAGLLARVAGPRPARARRLAAGAGGVLLALFLFAPIRGYYAEPLDRELRLRRGLPERLDPLAERRLRLVETARWLREHTPPTRGWEDPRGEPEYGVLASWTDGHLLRYEARRPVAVDNFGDDLDPARFELALEYLGAEEPRALEILDTLRARYAVVHFPTEPFGPTSMQARLYFHDGSATAQSLAFRGGRFESVPGEAAALAHHRLVYESDGLSFGPRANRQLPAFKVFERVAGARLAGRAPPGAEVALRLPVRTNRGRTFVWEARARADAEGRFVLPAPYSTRPASEVTAAMGPYRVSAAGAELRVAVGEDAVAAGAVVPVPPLGAQRGAGAAPSSR